MRERTFLVGMCVVVIAINTLALIRNMATCRNAPAPQVEKQAAP